MQAFLDDAAAAGANIETISFGALAADAVQILAAAATQACSVDGATLISTIDGLDGPARHHRHRHVRRHGTAFRRRTS